MLEINMLQGVLLYLLWCAFVAAAVVAFEHRRKPEYPREEGYPSGRRGRVWTELERSEYKQAHERKKLRIIQ